MYHNNTLRLNEGVNATQAWFLLKLGCVSSSQYAYPSQKSEKPRIAAFPFGAIFQLVSIRYAYPNQLGRNDS